MTVLMRHQALAAAGTLWLLTVAPGALAETSVQAGDVVEVTLNQLRPTQPAVGYDQVFYKLGRYQFDSEKLYDEVCETNGQGGVASIGQRAHPNLPDTFACDAAAGTHRDDMKTVVIAPNGDYYLTDGHHTFNTFWHMPQGGADFRVQVVVDQDYRELADMSAFWEALDADGNAWRYGPEGEWVASDEMPSSLGLHHFDNDPYRALMYFTRDSAWDKPDDPVPFLEFYWARELRERFDLADYDLTTATGYGAAIRDAGEVLLGLTLEDVGGSGRSVTEMGQFAAFDETGYAKMLAPQGKVDYMLRFKTASTGHGLAYDRTLRSASLLTATDALTLTSRRAFTDYPAVNTESDINVIVEIPTGSLAKWELSKEDPHQVIWEIKNGEPRIVEYLGYPGNYGSIPQTALPKELGGDGDPLDVLVLGQAMPRGAVVSARLIGVMKMHDDGEQDDKLVAVLTEDSPFSGVDSLAQLEAEFDGVTEIVGRWFTGYKGHDGGMELLGWGDEGEAREILNAAREHF